MTPKPNGTPRRRRLAVLAACGVAAVMAAGCSIPTQSRPSAISASHVPFHLLDPHAPTTSTTQPPTESLVPVKIYLLGPNAQSTTVQRLIASPAPLSSVLASLVIGPTYAEAISGVTTAIPTSVKVLSVTTVNNVVTVNFNTAFAQISGAATELAVSQVVFTVAAQNGAGTGVIFEIGGERTSVPVSSGAEVLGPVYALQFISEPSTTAP